MSSPTDTTPWRLDWDDSLSVGIPEIDADHQRFIRLVNELNLAIIERMALAEIRKRMQAIIDDAMQHFAHEERLFAQWGYPDAETHAQKHAEIVQSLQGIMAKLDGVHGEYDWIEAGLSVKEALITHLLAEDMKYSEYGIEYAARAGHGR